MEISQEIHTVLINLQKKNNELSDKIDSDIKRKSDLEEKVSELSKEIEKLNNSITLQEKKRIEISLTIDETEKGYNKIIDAGETLMAIISQNVADLN